MTAIAAAHATAAAMISPFAGSAPASHRYGASACCSGRAEDVGGGPPVVTWLERA